MKDSIKITKDNFWDTDLADIESTFLNGSKITDLKPTYTLFSSVERLTNLDDFVKKPTFFEKLKYFLKRK